MLAEAGPGRGTLMADALRASARRPRSALLSCTWSKRRRACALQAGNARRHLAYRAASPARPLLLFANEFLDALPIRQFVRAAPAGLSASWPTGGFVERRQPPTRPQRAAGRRAGNLRAGAGNAAGSAPASPRTAAPRCSSTTAPNTARRATACRRCATASRPTRSPTRRSRSHGPCGFRRLRRGRARGRRRRHGPVPQGMFLARLGLFQRTDRLARSQPPARAAALIEAARRLAEPDRMGRLFKALAVCHPGLPTPARIRADERPEAARRRGHSRSAHGFFTRRGGVSQRALRQPQLQPVRRRTSRRRAGKPRPRGPRLGAEPAHLVGLMQVHGADA